MKLKILFLFFIIISICFSFQVVSKEKTFQSIYKRISFYKKEKEFDKALISSKELLKKGIENKNVSQRAKAYYRIAEFQRKLSYSDSAYYYYNKSKELYLQLGDSIQVGRNLLNIAIIESNFGSYSLSDSTSVESIKFINGNRNKTSAGAYNCLAINSKKRNLYKQAIVNYQQAIELTDKNSFKNIYKNNLANVYKEQGNYNKAIKILSEILKDSILNLRTKVRIKDNLAHIKWLANPKENILGDLLYIKSVRLKENYSYDLIASYSHLSEYFKDINKKKSLFYAKNMYKIAKEEQAINGLLEAIDKIVELATPQKTIKYYKKSIRLRDSLQKEETKRQYQFASIKYNYEEEEKQKLKFKNLATENKLIAVQEKNEKKNIIIFAIVFFSGLIIYIFRRRQLQGKKLLEERYTTETRIAKQLHDDLGNSIYNTLVKVQDSNYTTEEIVNDLDKVYLKTRKISHDNDSVETGFEFENYLKRLLISYNSKDCKIILKDFSVLELNTLKKEKQIVLYRVCNELLVNMKKHSNANLVVISCKKENKFLEINYADNGVGFQNNAVIFKNGLKNMETRIKGIRGTFSFDSTSKKGCKVKIRFKN